MPQDEKKQFADLEIQLWPVAMPQPYANNPRKISQAAIDLVAKSISEFGFRQPIVVDGEGVIIVGHTRAAAARKLGLESVPVVVADDLTPAQVAAYRLADNRTNEESEWDYDLLAVELQDLGEFERAMTGFDEQELKGLIGPGFAPGSKEEQGALDKIAPIVCPSCGHSWHK